MSCQCICQPYSDNVHGRLEKSLRCLCGCFPLLSWAWLFDGSCLCTSGASTTPLQDYLCIAGCVPMAYIFCGPYGADATPVYPGCGLLCCQSRDVHACLTRDVTPQ